MRRDDLDEFIARRTEKNPDFATMVGEKLNEGKRQREVGKPERREEGEVEGER